MPQNDICVSEIEKMLSAYRNILFTAPVIKENGEDPFLDNPVIGAVLRRLAQAGRIDWAGYLSTTSVYGDHQGAWVDEETVAAPLLVRGKQRLQVERSFLYESGLPMHIFRLPGIYGPGRGPIARARAGKLRRVIKKGQVFSRVHVDDIVGCIKASLDAPNPGRIYNVTDDKPVPSDTICAFACDILGVESPPPEPFEEAKLTMSPMALSFYSECRRVSNRRMKEELSYKLLYPTYKEGFEAQVSEDLNGGWITKGACDIVNDEALQSVTESTGSKGQRESHKSVGAFSSLSSIGPSALVDAQDCASTSPFFFEFLFLECRGFCYKVIA